MNTVHLQMLNTCQLDNNSVRNKQFCFQFCRLKEVGYTAEDVNRWDGKEYCEIKRFWALLNEQVCLNDGNPCCEDNPSVWVITSFCDHITQFILSCHRTLYNHLIFSQCHSFIESWGQVWRPGYLSNLCIHVALLQSQCQDCDTGL